MFERLKQNAKECVVMSSMTKEKKTIIVITMKIKTGEFFYWVMTDRQKTYTWQIILSSS